MADFRLPFICLTLAVCSAIPSFAAPPVSVVISEFMAENNSGLRDEDGECQDWIELLNHGETDLDLSGHYLTDSAKNLAKWQLSDASIAAGKSIIVFASGKDRHSSEARQHTNFKLQAKGDFLAIVAPDGETIIHAYAPKYPKQRRDLSYGLKADWHGDPRQSEAYLRNPTPGSPNDTGVEKQVKPVKLSHKRGLYDEPFDLTLNCNTSNAVVRYTLDGTIPDLENGLTYTQPISIDQNMVVRVAAFRDGRQPSDVKTHTFVLPESVVRQSPEGLPPIGFPYKWGDNRVDYGMDPEIVNDEQHAQQVLDGLRALPSFSIVTDVDNLFSDEVGIYSNAQNDGREWERPCSVEMIHADGSDGFQIDCGIRVRGGFSRMARNPKHAFRLFFRKEYGPGKLRHAVFGKAGAESFDNLDLRTFQNYSWSFASDPRGIFLRDQFCRDLQLAMGQPAARGDFCHLYINGQYWGLYDTCERPEASYAESYFTGDKEDFDVIKMGRSEDGLAMAATDGELDAWRQQWELAHAGLESNEAYFQLLGCNPDGSRNPDYPVLLDPDNLITYMLIIFYGGNLDAPVTMFAGNSYPNNWYGIRNRKRDEGFRYFVWDAEHTFLYVNEDRTGPFPAGKEYATSNPQYIFQQCLDNAEFRMKVADHVYEHFYNGGILTPDAMVTRFQARAARIEDAVACESARWGDASLGGRGFGVGGGGARVDQDGNPLKGALGKQDWLREIKRIVEEYIPARSDIVLGQLYRLGVLPDITPPKFQPLAGTANGSELSLAADAGTIYYTTNGEDPRAAGGEVSSEAIRYGDAIMVSANAVVKARAMLDGQWSALAVKSVN